jgi:hypothetical protein
MLEKNRIGASIPNALILGYTPQGKDWFIILYVFMMNNKKKFFYYYAIHFKHLVSLWVDKHLVEQYFIPHLKHL